MAQSAADLIKIMRNVTGRTDANDPQFTDEIMLQRLNEFIQLQSTMDVRLFKNFTWYEFDLTAASLGLYPVDLQAITLANGNVGASTLQPPCYADGFTVFWFENPLEFYALWPETQEYQTSRPTYVLYYNNQLVFRNPPNQTYRIKIAAYQVEVAIGPDGLLDQDYLYRYLAYGASLDIFSDYGEMDRYAEIFPVFKRYRSLVYARTYSQYQNQRPSPEF